MRREEYDGETHLYAANTVGRAVLRNQSASFSKLVSPHC